MNRKLQDIPLNILLADDDADDRSFFETALMKIPVAHYLTSVHDGEELMNYLATHPADLPDIIFLDLSMPRKTGFECLIEINESDKLKNIPVVVFTTSFGRSSFFEQSLITTLSQIGAREYVRKPAGVDQLQTIIQKALIMASENSYTKWHETHL